MEYLFDLFAVMGLVGLLACLIENFLL